MLGVVLTAGKGNRLKPTTLFINKAILPVGSKPMIYYPLSTLVRSGIKNIVIIIGPPFGKQVIGIVKELKPDFKNISFKFAWQKKLLGMPDAISYAAPYAKKGPIVVVAGDNIFEGTYKTHVTSFKEGEISFLRQVDKPSLFACPLYGKSGEILDIIEKPKKPLTNLAITGPHIFDYKVFSFIKTLKPSKRGELEIVDLHKKYLSLNQLKLIKKNDFWADVGTFASLAQTSYYLLGKGLKK